MKTISNAFAKGTLATVAAGAMALASASPAMAQDRYRDRDGGISAGEIIAGALVIGGIAAVASSIGKDRNYRGTYGEPYYNGNYNSRYGYNNYGNPRQAVEQCVRAAQRGAYGARVTDIRDVDRKNYGYRVKGTVVVNERGGGWGRDYNYRYSGRNYDQGRFTCDVQGNRVVGLDYSGLRGYR
ncbi:hypothetical protein [Tsuneonella troitsensis]|jgi:hypothetical protein|uniref:hypothetical protein n=1 Tax=Tsuneonella troitsensis TaxID=292222 RepID=UPI00070C32BC|nr:hypothetical protein [Tsuneonella troitsensis]